MKKPLSINILLVSLFIGVCILAYYLAPQFPSIVRN